MRNANRHDFMLLNVGTPIGCFCIGSCFGFGLKDLSDTPMDIPMWMSVVEHDDPDGLRCGHAWSLAL